MRKTILQLTMLALCVGALSRTIAAQETPATKPAGSKAGESSADEELLKALVPDIPLGSSNDESSDGIPELDELDKTIAAMRNVGKRLDDGDTSDKTRELQAGILDDIDALIEKLKTQPPQQNPNQKPPQDQPQNDQEKPQQSESQSRPKTQPKPKAGKQPSGTKPTGSGAEQKQENKSAADSTEENLRQARARATELARRRALIDEFWGHLPAALRERLLNVGSEKILPQYEELIRRYNESLADSPDVQKR